MTPRRADLHVHTRHSRVSGNLRFLRSRDCYSRPADVYRVARRRGMDYVAFTDHDSIGGALELLEARPDLADRVIVGEEVSCTLPDGGVQVHLAVYGMTEALHRDLQPLRENVFDVIARLREADVFFALNHLLHFYRGQVPLDRYLALVDLVPAVEARNGTMAMAHNALIERIASEGVGDRFRTDPQRKRSPTPSSRIASEGVDRASEGVGDRFRPIIHRKRSPTPSSFRTDPQRKRSPTPSIAMTAGSDAHTLRRVGTTWTEAPGSTRDEFLANVRRGLGVPRGAHGTARTIAADAYGVIARYVASLAGFGPCDLAPWRRAACLAFSAGSAPFQFVPLLMAARSKAGERRAIEHLSRHLAPSIAEREELQPV